MNAYRLQSRRTRIIGFCLATVVTFALLGTLCDSMLFPSPDATARRIDVLAAEAARASAIRAEAAPVEVASTPDAAP
ncbi:MAG TPA: hypothetical protein VLR71_11015 [Casimicrobiaceae bacterium]|nr:hypothetical protein [Casimicrobiaceae bacterium]